MISQPEFPEGFRRGALVRGWDLGRSRQPLAPEQIEAAQRTQERLMQMLSELSQWLPEIAPATTNQGSDDAFIERIVREVITQLQQ